MKKFITTLVLTAVVAYGFAQTTPNSPTTYSSVKESTGKGGTGTPTFDLGFQYHTNTSPLTTFGMNVGIGYRYYMHNNFFAEGLIGYRWTIATASTPKITTNEHDITLPIHVGGFIPISDKFGIGLLVGPRIDFPVAYKSELNNKKVDSGKPDVHTALELGCDFRLSDWGIRFIYGIGLGADKSNYIGLGLSTGF